MRIKTLFIVLSCLILVALVGCTNDKTENPDDGKTVVTTPTDGETNKK